MHDRNTWLAPMKVYYSPPLKSGTPPIDDSIAKAIDDLYELRLESLLSVDDLVKEVVQTLEVRMIILDFFLAKCSPLLHNMQAHDLIDNTYIFYNSDHGMLGSDQDGGSTYMMHVATCVMFLSKQCSFFACL